MSRKQMRGIGFIAFVLAMALLVTARYRPLPPPLSRDETTARVTRVIDGDTIAVEGGERVRYIGMDCPELRPRGRSRPEPYAVQATEENARLVAGKRVRLVFDDDRRDRYDRLLAYVYADGTFVNLRLVERGLAIARVYPPNTDHQAEMEAAEARARRAGVGMWRE